MIAGKVTIFYKSYKPQYPVILTIDSYNYYKSVQSKKIPKIKFRFWKEFYSEIIMISLGILALIADEYHWFLRGGLMELLEALFGLVAIVGLFSFIPSATTFIVSYFKTNEYINRLDRTIKDSLSYYDFCKLMSKYDKSYIMQMKRMSNEISN